MLHNLNTMEIMGKSEDIILEETIITDPQMDKLIKRRFDLQIGKMRLKR